MINLIEELILSFRGREMNGAQNMAVYNLIESVMGEEAATAFSKVTQSSDEKHDSRTTYTFNRSVEDAWMFILSSYMDETLSQMRRKYIKLGMSA